MPAVQDQQNEGVLGVGFAEQIRKALALSGEPEDRILVEVGAEIDRLENLLTLQSLKPSVLVNASGKRTISLIQLNQLIKSRKKEQDKNSVISVIASLVRLLQEVLDDLSTPKEVRQTIVQNLLMKLEQTEKNKDKSTEKEPSGSSV